jgi:hypothetical protein
MAKVKTECSCGAIHEFDGEAAKNFEGDIPEYIDCSECPVCSPELLEKPEDYEDEAYTEDVDIEKLNIDDISDDLDIDDEDLDTDFREEF